MRETLSKNLPIWDKLTDSEQRLLLSGVHNMSCSNKEMIYSAGDDCLGVVLVSSGKLRVYMMSDEGREVTLYYVDAGEWCMFTASCVINQLSFEVHVEAVEETSLLVISPRVFSTLKKDNLYVENFAYKMIANNFSDVMWAMQQLLFTSIDKRVASYLLDMSSKEGSNLNITHEQIAVDIGSAREVVSRCLKKMEQEGFIKLKRGYIEILDKNKIKEMIR